MLYGFLAPLVFDKLFFPNADPLVGTIAVLGIFAIGFVARPLGGLFFGHFGDRLGRKPVMAATFILMDLSTTAIGLRPTYESFGIARQSCCSPCASCRASRSAVNRRAPRC